MKNITKKKLQKAFDESGISEDILGDIDFCLLQLYIDKTKCIEDKIVHNLTFEKLIGVLLGSRKTIQRESDFSEQLLAKIAPKVKSDIRRQLRCRANASSGARGTRR